MAWQRKTPFGYEIIGGIIRPHPAGSEAVRYIFSQYLAGASLQTVAERMTARGPRYHEHSAAWNKNMVKHILENPKYTGADGCPALVSAGDFAEAQRLRAERNTYAPLPAEIRPIQAKAVCGLCGGRMSRGSRSHGRVHWKCQNESCGQTVSLSDEALAERTERCLRELARSPELLAAPEAERPAPDLEAVRLQNELTLALNRGENPETIQKLSFSLAARRYAQLPDPTPAHRLEQLRARLERGRTDGDTLAELFDLAVKSVRSTPESVDLELKNRIIISEMEAQSA